MEGEERVCHSCPNAADADRITHPPAKLIRKYPFSETMSGSERVHNLSSVLENGPIATPVYSLCFTPYSAYQRAESDR